MTVPNEYKMHAIWHSRVINDWSNTLHFTQSNRYISLIGWTVHTERFGQT